MKILLGVIIAFILIGVASGIWGLDEKRTPYSVFKERIARAPMCEYVDPEFGYTVSYPCFFEREEVNAGDARHGYARFAYHNNANIVIDTCVVMPPESERILAEYYGTKTGLQSGCEENRKWFVRSEKVTQNGVEIPGYSRFAKYIVSGKTLFMVSVTYPDEYRPAMSRLMRLVTEWTVIGTC